MRVTRLHDRYMGVGKAYVFLSDTHIDDPLLYKQVIKDLDKVKWIISMKFKMELMYSNQMRLDLLGESGFIRRKEEHV